MKFRLMSFKQLSLNENESYFSDLLKDISLFYKS